MSYVETAWNHANIPVELAGLKPLGDFVLVKVMPEEEMHKNLIWLPQFSGAHADRERRPVMPSVGEVVACGPGDKAIGGKWYCTWCYAKSHEPEVGELVICQNCGTAGCMQAKELFAARDQLGRPTDRLPMHVSPGDRVLYWRSPANEVILNDETFQFIHEEQHLLGVIEA